MPMTHEFFIMTKEQSEKNHILSIKERAKISWELKAEVDDDLIEYMLDTFK